MRVRIHWRRFVIEAALVAGSASAAGAHPGHGLGGGSDGWLHYLTEPLHAAPPALVAVTLVLAWRRWRDWRRRTHAR